MIVGIIIHCRWEIDLPSAMASFTVQPAMIASTFTYSWWFWRCDHSDDDSNDDDHDHDHDDDHDSNGDDNDDDDDSNGDLVNDGALDDDHDRHEERKGPSSKTEGEEMELAILARGIHLNLIYLYHIISYHIHFEINLNS